MFALDDCLWGVAKLTKNTDNDKYGYSGYVFDFIHVQPFRYQFMELVKMLLLFVQTTLYQDMFIYQSLEKVRLMSWTITSEKEYGLHITERGKNLLEFASQYRISIFGTLMVQESVNSKQKIK